MDSGNDGLPAGRELGETPLIHPGASVTRCTLGRYVEIGAGSALTEVDFGDYSYTAAHADIAYATVGKFCSIAAMTRINPGNHATWRASQHHFTYRSRMYGLADSDDDTFFDWRRDHHVTLGHDVWLGHGAIILPGNDVGIGAVVAAGAVVSKPVDPYTIVAGVPARPVKRRFSPAVAERLMALAWWDWPHERLKAALHDFRDLPIEAFIEKHGT
ncbi:chloramphenicol acetyltransferase [Pseudochelatococcus sp. B33]